MVSLACLAQAVKSASKSTRDALASVTEGTSEKIAAVISAVLTPVDAVEPNDAESGMKAITLNFIDFPATAAKQKKKTKSKGRGHISFNY